MKKITKLFLVLICLLTSIGLISSNAEIKVDAATKYTQRLSAPELNNAYYYSNANPFYAAGLAPTAGLDADGNCTWYAFGRAYEILGRYPSGLSTGMPNQWYYQSTNFKKGSTPKIGAIAVWQGHVAVVEDIQNGIITLSGSSYRSGQYPNGKRFLIQKGTQSQIAAMNGGGFIGYIYIVDDATVDRPQTETNLRMNYQTYDELGYTNGVINAPQVAGNPNTAANLHKIKVNTNTGNLKYRIHLANVGWEDKYYNQGSFAGDGKNDIEAIQMQLDGSLANKYDLYYATYIEGYGWSDWAKNNGVCGSTGLSKGIKALRVTFLPKGTTPKFKTAKPYLDKNNYQPPVTMSYQTHLVGGNWLDYVPRPNIAGNIGKNNIDGIRVNLGNYNNDLVYRVCSNNAWSSYRTGGQVAGSAGKPVEAVQMNLRGDLANKYDLYYAVYVEGYGWLNWAKATQVTGSIGLGRSIQGLRIQIMPKGTKPTFAMDKITLTQNDLGVKYSVCMNASGWLPTVDAPKYSGIAHQNQFVTNLKAMIPGGYLSYRTHIANKGWESKNSANNGVAGDGVNAVEAIQMNLSGDAGNKYDLYYRVYVRSKGWLGWAGETRYAGTTGYGLPIEAVQIMLVPKGGAAPTSTTNCYFAR